MNTITKRWMLIICTLVAFTFMVNAVSQETIKITINQAGEILKSTLNGKTQTSNTFWRTTKFSKGIRIQIIVELQEALEVDKEYTYKDGNETKTRQLKDGKIEFKLNYEKKLVEVCDLEENKTAFICGFKLNVSDSKREIQTVAVRMDAIKPESTDEFKSKSSKKNIIIFTFPKEPLTKKGVNYTLSILRYYKESDRLKENVSSADKIFKEVFQIYNRYSLGLNAGVFKAFKGEDTYGLEFINSNVESEQLPKIVKGWNNDIKGVFLISWYPLGLEPERPLRDKQWCRRISINVGTEFSSNILNTYYCGIGYDFNVLSVNLLLRRGKISNLMDGYNVGEHLLNPNISAVPVTHEYETTMGISVAFPINFATSFLGKLLGI